MSENDVRTEELLAEYRRKRDFQKTGEPAGGVPSPAGRSFVIQKHAARRLHYDFRLEMDGVLKSWAVPKGPSLDPADRRMAVHVEDHPLEYGSFEGTIPKGEYGGGTVMLWDTGTWEPQGDPHTMYRNGNLKFRLHGTKLNGGWALVKLHIQKEGEKETWLLIKERDEAVRPGDGDAAIRTLDCSVATGRSMQQIAVANNAIWTRSEGGRDRVADLLSDLPPHLDAPFPGFVPPQLATLVETPPAGEGWLHEIKFDGYRLLAKVDGATVRLISRNGKDWSTSFPTIVDALRTLGLRQAWLDGEVAIVRPDGTTSFQDLQNLLTLGVEKPPTYFLFDLMYLNGKDLRNLSLLQRKDLLKRLLPDTLTDIRFSDHVIGNGWQFFRSSCGVQLEGIISKEAASRYTGSRTRAWQKVKCSRRQEFVVGGYSEPSGSRHGFGALLVGAYEEDRLTLLSKVGTGFNEKSLREIYARLRELEQEESPFVNPPSGAAARGIHWVRPVLVAEIGFTEITSDRSLRHPVFHGFRFDKDASTITLEQPASAAPTASETPAAPEAGKETRRKAPLVIEEVKLSHPDRILYPVQGLTKRNLADYYLSVAELMLPHLRNRPLTLVRCPDGRHNECFYQKHFNGTTPDAVDRAPLEEKGKQVEYMQVSSAQGLLGLVQMGVLEIHTWNSRHDAVEYPDRLVFDLDPDEGLPWPRVAEGALLVRNRLAELGLESFLKTTGGKGLHIVVPVIPERNWDHVRDFARAVAENLAGSFPEKFTPKMTKTHRTGKIFLDWMRNIRGSTAVEVYSTRAREGATVSVPLHWEELLGEARPWSFTVINLAERLQTQTSDPWERYFEVQQHLPPEHSAISLFSSDFL